MQHNNEIQMSKYSTPNEVKWGTLCLYLTQNKEETSKLSARDNDDVTDLWVKIVSMNISHVDL